MGARAQGDEMKRLGLDSKAPVKKPGGYSLLLFFITLKPRVELYTKSMSLKYEPASEPLHISVKQLFSN